MLLPPADAYPRWGMRAPAGACSRRAWLMAVGGVALGAAVEPLLAQDGPDDAELEGASGARTVRVGSPATGVVSTVALEVYVARVLAAEADPRAPDAAREAMAIAIRTYALVNAGRHAREGYDVCDTTHCQVARTASPATRRLTARTTGQVLTFEGVPAHLYYSASCGGVSERASDVWPGTDRPYLQARVDDAHDGELPWTFSLSLDEADEALRRAGCAGRLREVQVATRTSSGRAGTVRLVGMDPVIFSGNDFRLALGGTRLRSTAFALAVDANTLHFEGRGYGHGVGMCAVGASVRAGRGESAGDILQQYYPGLTLARLDGGRTDRQVAPRPQPFPRPR